MRHARLTNFNPKSNKYYIHAMVTGHGKTRAYLHRFKILDNANFPAATEIIYIPFNIPVIDTAYAKKNTHK